MLSAALSLCPVVGTRLFLTPSWSFYYGQERVLGSGETEMSRTQNRQRSQSLVGNVRPEANTVNL